LDTEDGSFHEDEFHGHLGFDRDELEATLVVSGLSPVSYEFCYELEHKRGGKMKKYPLFLLVAKKDSCFYFIFRDGY